MPVELLAAGLEAVALLGPGLLAVVAVPKVLAEPFRIRGPKLAETKAPELAKSLVGAELLAGLAWEVDGERLAGAVEQPRI